MNHDDDIEESNDDKKTHKHKKKIEWMIEYLEKGVSKGRIENKEEARKTIAFLEALHDEIGESKPERPKDKKEKKDRNGEAKKSKV